MRAPNGLRRVATPKKIAIDRLGVYFQCWENNMESRSKPREEGMISIRNTRRQMLLKTAGGAAALAGASPITAASPNASDVQRLQESYMIRLKAAEAEHAINVPPHPTNSDEQRYPNRIGNYSKGLPHDS